MFNALEIRVIYPFNNFGANCDGLTNSISINDCITCSHCVSEDNLPFLIL